MSIQIIKVETASLSFEICPQRPCSYQLLYVTTNGGKSDSDIMSELEEISAVMAQLQNLYREMQLRLSRQTMSNDGQGVE